MANIDLIPEHTVAIHKAIKEDLFKEARKVLRPGEYLADFAVRVAGRFKVSEPYKQAMQQAFPWQRLALMLATRVPVHVLNAVLRQLHDDEALDDMKDHVLVMWGEIANENTRETKKVTHNLTVEVM